MKSAIIPITIILVLASQMMSSSNVEDRNELLKVFEDFRLQNGKIYSSSEEYDLRLEIFRENIKRVEELNRMYNPKTIFGITPFTDLSQEEFSRKYLMRKTKPANENVEVVSAISISSPIPPSFDWRARGAVTQVRNQGDCGSCYAFSVCGEIEGKYFLKTGELVAFSPQMIVDCDEMELGCGGGNQFGLETWKDYPYIGGEGGCQRKKDKLKIKTISKYMKLEKNETFMMEYLYKHGPLSILFDATNLQHYKSGIWDPKDCDPTLLDHAVLITGYNSSSSTSSDGETENSNSWWNVKNSWGDSWGENGYFRIVKGKGICGIDRSVYSCEL